MKRRNERTMIIEALVGLYRSEYERLLKEKEGVTNESNTNRNNNSNANFSNISTSYSSI